MLLLWELLLASRLSRASWWHQNAAKPTVPHSFQEVTEFLWSCYNTTKIHLKPKADSDLPRARRNPSSSWRPAFQRTRNCSRHLEERLIIVHRSSYSHTDNYSVFTCKYPSAHGFSGKCQLHRCNPGAQIWELGIERSTQAPSQLWTGIIIIISPSGYICHSITMVDDSISLPHLFTPL